VHRGYFVRSWKALSCTSRRLYERNSGNVSRPERVIAQGTRRNTECIYDKPIYTVAIPNYFGAPSCSFWWTQIVLKVAQN